MIQLLAIPLLAVPAVGRVGPPQVSRIWVSTAFGSTFDLQSISKQHPQRKAVYFPDFQLDPPLDGPGKGKVMVNAQLDLGLIGNDGKTKDFNLQSPSQAESPALAKRIYANLATMMDEMEKAKEHRERLPESLEKGLNEPITNLASGLHELTVAQIVTLIHPTGGPPFVSR